MIDRSQSLFFYFAVGLSVCAGSGRPDAVAAKTSEAKLEHSVIAESEGRGEVKEVRLECRDGIEMGTPFRICVAVQKEQRLHFELDLSRAFRRIREINAWMSEWQPDTELSKVNRAAGARPEPVRKELFDVLAATLQIAKQSDGALDPSFNALWGLYKFKPGDQRSPSDHELAERLPLIDYKSVVLNASHSSVFLKKPGMKLGLGAIGQGYAVDQAVGLLKQRGYTGGYVDGSGDTRFWGHKPDGAAWMTGVRDPRDKDKVLLRIYGTDLAVTSCGDDEKFFFKNGVRVHHIIDPRTGRPAKLSRQVTVIAPTAFLADAWDTAAFVMGPEFAQKRLESLGLDAVIVGADGQITLTKGLVRQTDPRWGVAYLWKPQLKTQRKAKGPPSDQSQAPSNETL